ncbi:MAG: hypothetical protein B0W54_04645 [Cellvibrio sp. 79]|nr:MAG: hypothetical protein B0W54_04645 [Cellvibrio sp. 79]
MENYSNNRGTIWHRLRSGLLSIGCALVLAAPVVANELACTNVFPEALQSHKATGEISFDWNAQLLGASDNTLRVIRVNNLAWSMLATCGNSACTAAGAPSAAVIPAIDSGNSVTDYRVNYRGTALLGSAQASSFRTITVDTEGQLGFQKISGAYRINHLNLGYSAVLNLAPGTYWLNRLTLGSLSKINVVGEGTARIFVKENISFPWKAYANMQAASQPLNASKLFIYTEGNVELQTDAEVSAIIYSGQRLSLASAKFYGVSSFFNANLGASSKVTYQSGAVAAANLTGFCGANSVAPPVFTSAPAATPAAGSCPAVFANGVQTHAATGAISFDYNAQLHNASSAQLNTKSVNLNSGSNKPSCGTTQCVASGQVAPKFETKLFQQSVSTLDVTVPWMATTTIGDNNSREFGSVTVNTSATLIMQAQSAPYHIKQLSLAYSATLKLPAGDYWIEKLLLDSSSNIEVVGAGTVRLFVKESVVVPWMVKINDNTKDAGKFIFYSYGDVVFNTANTIYALVYTESDGKLEYSTAVQGAFSARNIILATDSQVTYKPDAVALANYGAICDGEQPLPDLTPPVLSVNTLAASTENETIVVSGTVSDPVQYGSGIASVVVKIQSGAQVQAVLNGNNFSATVTLTPGDNLLAVEARDFSGNITVNNAAVKRISLPTLESIVPADGTETSSSSVKIQGRVLTAWPLAQTQLSINNATQVLTQVSTGVYQFQSADLALVAGINEFRIKAQTPDGVKEQLLKITYKPLVDTVAPQLTLNNIPGSTDAETITITGTVIDGGQPVTGVAKVSASVGQGAAINASITGNQFSVAIPLVLGSNSIVLTALDNAGNSSSQTVIVKRISMPVFAQILPADGSNLTENQARIHGQVHTLWPSASVEFFLNNSSKPLTQTQAGIYQFDVVNVPLQVGENIFKLRAATPDGTKEVTLTLNYGKPDSDNDGHPDDEDLFPNDPNEWADLDGDGIGDNSDPDRDGDGISNDHETELGNDPNDPDNKPDDVDEDGIPDQLDDDRDGDGHANAQDLFPDDATEWADLDADGIGDNADTDRDGDGFSNAVEEERDTDPNNVNDYPDTVAPLLQILNPAGERTENANFVLHGSISDPVQPQSGVKDVIVTSDKFANVNIAATINEANFTVEVPLALGANKLTVTARDNSGNAIQATYQVQRIALPRFQNITPANLSTITENKVTIAGQIHTAMPLEGVRFYIKDSQITPSGTGTPDVYAFNLPDVSLALGQNTFLLRAETADGVVEQTLVLTHTPTDPDKIKAPEISLVSPANKSLLNVADFKMKARVVSHAGAVKVTVNGQPIALSSANDDESYFESALSFDRDQDTLNVTIEVTDTLNKKSTLNPVFYLDRSLPQISVHGLDEAPAINTVVNSPFVINGTVRDTNLASVTINGQSGSLKPGAVLGSYDFSIPLSISAGEQIQWVINARDSSGNSTNATYIFQSAAQASLSPLLPGDNAEFLYKGQPLVVQIAARVSDLPEGTRVVATLGEQQINLARAGTLASGEITLPSQAGNYVLHYKVLDAAQTVVAATTRTLNVINEDAIAITLVNHEPENSATNIETNQPIELYFNKAIDASKLSISVTETLHGNTYIDTDQPGLDFLNAKGYQLKEVNYDNQAISGSYSVLPGNQIVAFYTSRQFGFNGDVRVNVSYDNKELARFSFKIRPLPTFVIGGVADQFGQPLAGVKVNLPDLGRTATTNKDGSFAFGFQEPAGKEIPGGRHKIIVNPDFSLPGYGVQVRTLTLQEGRKNEVGLMRLTELHPEIPFQLVSSGQAEVNFAGGDLKLDLSAARLLFNNGRPSGNVQYQFMPFEQVNTAMTPGLWPQWMFSAQPRGVVVENSVGIDIKMPALNGSYDYIPAGLEYVVLLGYDPEREVIEPVGIGKIQNYRVVSLGELNIKTLDHLGYAWIDPKHQPLLKQVADGTKSMQQLISTLQQ